MRNSITWVGMINGGGGELLRIQGISPVVQGSSAEVASLNATLGTTQNASQGTFNNANGREFKSPQMNLTTMLDNFKRNSSNTKMMNCSSSGVKAPTIITQMFGSPTSDSKTINVTAGNFNVVTKDAKVFPEFSKQQTEGKENDREMLQIAGLWPNVIIQGT